jgi:hypothetical protein
MMREEERQTIKAIGNHETTSWRPSSMKAVSSMKRKEKN